MDKNIKRTIREIKNIEEMIEALCDSDRYQIIDMLNCEIDALKSDLKYDANIRKAELLKVRIELLKKGIIVYSDCFCEECMYLLNYIKRGECSI